MKDKSFYCLRCDEVVKFVKLDSDNFYICKLCGNRVNVIKKDKEEI